MDAPSTVRPATRADLAQVVALERAAFADPWSADAFRECVDAGVTFLAAVRGAAVVGYVVARSAADQGEILNVAVAPDARRQGIGAGLVRRALAALAAQGARQVFLEVRESNAPGIALYRGLGFAPVSRRTGYYRRPVEDAIILAAAIVADGRLA